MNRRELIRSLFLNFTVGVTSLNALSASASASVSAVGPRRYTGRALVIGNANYEDVPLQNPIRDATLVKNILSYLGFDVIFIVDANKTRMREEIESFCSDDNAKDVNILYFAGHGVAIGGKPYIVSIEGAREGDWEALFSAAEVLEKFCISSVQGLAIFDCCRTPFDYGVDSVTNYEFEGLLNPYEKKLGWLFSTQRDGRASDGRHLNGPFATSLARYLDKSGLCVQDMALLICEGVQHSTCSQRPQMHGFFNQNSSLFEDGPIDLSARNNYRESGACGASDVVLRAAGANGLARASNSDYAYSEAAIEAAILALRAGNKAELPKVLSILSASQEFSDRAATYLAFMYERGIFVKKDLVEARQRYKSAAFRGNKMAMNNYAALVAQEDPREAFRWLSKAVDLGFGPSYSGLAEIYSLGAIVEKNETKAMELLESGAEKNDTSAIYDLAIMEHRAGKVARYMSLLKRSAELGFAKAEYLYGVELAGREKERTVLEEARRYLRLSEKHGMPLTDAAVRKFVYGK